MSGRVALIPARGGSRRIPRKNIREFHGRPMIQYPIQTALFSGLFARVIVSTEDHEVAAVAKDAGAEVLMRSAALALDAVGTQELMKALVQDIKAKHFCCIYPCSPMITEEDLAVGLQLLDDDRHALYAMTVGDAPLRDAGNFYWGVADAFRVGDPLVEFYTRLVVLPEERVCDVNTFADWTECERKYEAWTERLDAEGAL